MIMLDTCALLWLASGGGKLSEAALEQIDSVPAVCISAISAFEISLKYRQGKLELPVLPDEWFRVVLEHHDISVRSLDIDICIAANDLPPVHKDPCDRLIIATAKLHNFPVVTGDSRFEEYDIEVIS
ncbi:MAG: type II toxin-antitoxin system VapC family toxin [Candidatus Cloacimonadota bacterium]|nr:type II toxin-antitoxin system VapC family toxin [Candidatus Cloacimonadota bacterium]